MTTKKILDKQQIYNRDELKKLNRDELVQIMVKYSLKHKGFRKDVLIDSILEYQEHINDIKSKLVTNNSIEQYHRGTVEYRLPTLIIYRIIRDLWHEDTYLWLDVNDLPNKYRWLLSIALVSKEFFKLISSLFNRFAIMPNSQQAIKQTISFAKLLRISVLNPHSVLKNISDLTFSTKLLSEITKKSISSPIELGLIFNNVRRFCMFNESWKENGITLQQCRSIIEYIPNIESLVFYQMYFICDIFLLLKTLPRLTSLDISSSEISRERNFTSDLLSHSIKKLKLPTEYSYPYKSILSDQHKLTTFGIGRITLEQFQMISGHFMHITKMIIKRVIESVAVKFEELLCSPDCKVRTLITDTTNEWIKRVLNKNQLIDTIDINYSLDETFNFISKSASIKRFIFNTYSIIPTDQYMLRLYNQATGFAHIKSKNSNFRSVTYAVKIYEVSENQNENEAVESTYPHLKFLYADISKDSLVSGNFFENSFRKMTTKEILDKQQIYSKDELVKWKNDDLVKLMSKYSLKGRSKKKDSLIDSILKYQEHINDIKSKLVTDNPIEQYHRGTVEYRLPTLIIYRIIRDLWHEDTRYWLNVDQLHRNYRWLLSIASVSKEYFKLISSLFNRFAINPNPQQTNKLTVSLSQQLRGSVLSPPSVLKNISHLTLSTKVFNEITQKSVCAPIELGLIFNNVRRFCMFNNVGSWRTNSIQAQQCKLIIEYMPNIESLGLINLLVNRKEFLLLISLPSLTSLDLSEAEFFKVEKGFNSDLLSHSIKKLKLPMSDNKPYKSTVSYNQYKRILSDQHQLTTFGIGRITLEQIQKISGHFIHITKLIIKRVHRRVAPKFEELLCSPDCKVRTLITDSKYGWIKSVLSNNQTIDTIDFNNDLDETFNFISKFPSIKRFIFNTDKDNSYHYTMEDRSKLATGFAHVKSKSQNFRMAGYAEKIYNVSKNEHDNLAVESTYSHLKFLYAGVADTPIYSSDSDSGSSSRHSDSDSDDNDSDDSDIF
ncbi:hypothetical protein PPL_01988 [Heterostelium album PN500]|uniref:Uncharacterized protein n=1 Tax=Heterostelium pallidum (strain ATCC 26659 / Pp 5 / PN500) TaxID=670386 RepID=D3B120_HETP5|nr:hypothetical protein PPL_01988 [Heterostelium album PN500]EFA84994.1 hypothetical protein PPL_01988 [Heterostelium album PN500]|eukprot:XP_020437104.1 hypothetical protein PPL_01988 [Heterostelium album PN500]